MTTPALLLSLFYILALAVVFLCMIVTMTRSRRWCERENERLRSEYRAARAKGELVVPPNVWRYGP